jgi:carotenoid cleavage dioxygenase-like enzyme
MVNKMSTSRESPQINPPLFDEEDSRLDAAIDVDTFNKTSVYNVPGYKPVHVELTHVAARVTGKLPEDLGGVYLRNGTNVQFERTFQRLHAFTGAGMIH